MAGKSNTLADAHLNLEFRAVTRTFPTNHYIALFSTMPTDAGTGGVELSAGNYARVAVSRASGSWSAPAAGAGNIRQITNAAIVDFGTATADWAPSGTPCVGFGVFDAASGGTFLGGGAFGSSVVIQSGNPVRFPIGALVIADD
jgi:hypothetical protein